MPSSSDEKHRDQNYSKIRKHHRDLGVPWTDPTFPPNDSSIGAKKAKDFSRAIQWKRPSELTKDPHLLVNGTCSQDATQGKLGNCWFVAACSVLAGSRPLWERVVPDWKDQEWSKENEYSGVFRFRFWRFGKWVEVLVDDLLPTIEGELVFLQSKSRVEFWGALLEKAYAKLHGSYEVLDGGNLSDGLIDFTGGVCQDINIEDDKTGYRTDDLEKKKSLFKMMTSDIEDHALMCCAIKAVDASEIEKKTDLGLVKGHAYGITALRKVLIGGTGLVSLFKGKEKLYLVRLQNPWGEKEWTGPFGDRSPEWNNISEKEREKLGLTFDDDGEFWMPFDDFLHQFTTMSICRVINTSVFSMAKTWNEVQFFGSWKTRVGSYDRAGGCRNNPDTFLNNPQYRFDIYKAEEDVIVHLAQRDQRGESHQGHELFVIGFHIMRVEANRKYRLHKLHQGQATSDYIKSKHVFLKTKLPRGRYVIVPTTYNPGENADFMLRVFTDDDAGVTAMEKDLPTIPWWQCLAAEPAVLTRIIVKEACGLENQDTFGKSDPYCLIKCEGKEVRSEVVHNTMDPKWARASAVFYRTDPSKPITVEIWNKNMVMDSFMGRTTLDAPLTTAEATTHSKELYGRKSKAAEKMLGTVAIEVETRDDLTAL